MTLRIYADFDSVYGANGEICWIAPHTHVVLRTVPPMHAGACQNVATKCTQPRTALSHADTHVDSEQTPDKLSENTHFTPSLYRKFRSIVRITPHEEIAPPKEGPRVFMNAVIAEELSMVAEDPIVRVEHRVARVEDRLTRVESDVAEIKSDIKTLKGDYQDFKVEVAKEFGALRAELKGSFESVNTAIERTKVWMLSTGIATVLAVAALLGLKSH